MSATRISPEGTDSAAPGPEGRRTRRRPGRGLAVAVVLAVAAGGVLAVVQPWNDASGTASSDSGAPTALARVTQETLSARTQQSGTLGYAGSYKVVNNEAGTATGLPAVGRVMKRGKALYWVDGEPVVYLYGARTPVFRDLELGVEGTDVKQLNAELVDLGYAETHWLDPKSDYFGFSTRYALMELQEDLGVEETGSLALGEAVFIPSKEFRVTDVESLEGAGVRSSGMIMEGTSTERQVTVSLSASRQSEVKVGDKVEISLPNGKSTQGEVTSVGKVAKKSSTGTTVNVNIRPTDQKATGRLDQAPVQVSIVTDSAKDVLTVPVNALLALSGGGYGVEVVGADNARKLIRVETGLFDDSAGRVEVTGSGLAAGQHIVVPAS